jgi:hypothetical protein
MFELTLGSGVFVRDEAGVANLLLVIADTEAVVDNCAIASSSSELVNSSESNPSTDSVSSVRVPADPNDVSSTEGADAMHSPIRRPVQSY